MYPVICLGVYTLLVLLLSNNDYLAYTAYNVHAETFLVLSQIMLSHENYVHPENDE